MENLQLFINQLNEARTKCISELRAIDNALAALRGNRGTARRTATTNGNIVVMKRSRMSAAARNRIRLAQKTRWAKWRKTQRSA